MSMENRPGRSAQKVVPLLALAGVVAFGGLGLTSADTVDDERYRDLCDDVPQDLPLDVDNDGQFDEITKDDRDWKKRLDACNTLLEKALVEETDPDPDIYYYAGRLEFMVRSMGMAQYRFAQGAHRGSVKAMTALGYYHWRTGNDLEKLVEWFQKAAERGDPIAQTELGLIYAGLRFQWADALKFDRARAQSLLKSAAAQGDPLAHHMLGVITWPEKEEGNEEEAGRALEHVKTAAKNGLFEAQQMLREEGYEVPKANPDHRWAPTAIPAVRILRRP